MTNRELRHQVVALAREMSDDLIEWRRQIHQHPELSYDEFGTSSLVSGLLQEWGIDTRVEVDEPGVLAELEGDRPGPTIALRADLDALPIQEETGLPYASTRPGISHACGHDMHTAMLLGAASVLSRIRGDIEGRVRFLFQPAEETPPGGSLLMLDRGAMEDVDAVMALHVQPSLPCGVIGLRNGLMTATINEIRITVRGAAGHSARPHDAIDPILVGANVIRELYSVFDREVNRQDPVVLAFGIFHAGNAPNVVPGTATIAGTLRCATLEQQREAPKRIRRVLDGICRAWNASYELHVDEGYPPVNNDASLTETLRSEVRDLWGAEMLHEVPHQSMGAEDFSRYLLHAPGCMARLGVGHPANNGALLHSGAFNPDEAALSVGAGFLAAGALRWMEHLGREARGGPLHLG